MKMQTLLKHLQKQETYYSTLCKTWPEIVFQSVTDGKTENFFARYDSEKNNIVINGVLANPLELHYLLEFLQGLYNQTGFKVEDIQAMRNGQCVCGKDDWEYIGKSDWFPAPLAGGVDLMFKCKSCGKYSTFQTIIR